MDFVHSEIMRYSELHSDQEDEVLNSINRETHLKILKPIGATNIPLEYVQISKEITVMGKKFLLSAFMTLTAVVSVSAQTSGFLSTLIFHAPFALFFGGKPHIFSLFCIQRRAPF